MSAASELSRFLDFARAAAYEAGRHTLGYFYRSLEVIDKADGSPVTVADREAEQILRAAIEKAFPDHAILGEEFGRKEARNGSPYTWYLDPIDGTKSFIHGVPMYSNLVGLLCEDRSVLGIINLPALGEMISAADGHGCWLNGRRVKVSDESDLSRAVVLTTDQTDLARSGVTNGWKSLVEGARFTRTWGDAYGYALVATGRAEIMLDARAETYDIAALPPILREAGGQFFDWTGRETIFGGNGIATNAALANLVRQRIGGA
ncbi:histidinol phosphate phosphatase [bacterium]|nr:histidinol phosphate phosphatase [bacterium]